MAKSTNSGNARGGVQVISRVAQILRALNGEHLGLGPTELAGRVNLTRSTVHRILTALEAEGLVSAPTPGRYRVGPEITRLAVSERGELRSAVRPFIEQISKEVNETVDLAVLIQDHVLFIDQVVAPQRLRAVSTVGATFPAHCTANGKALLAELSDDHLLMLLPEALQEFTPNTCTSRDRLMAELREIRRTGVAFDDQEHTLGISAVGAGVRDAFGAVAAVTIPLPSQRYLGNEEHLTAILRAACQRISEALGAPTNGAIAHTPAGWAPSLTSGDNR
jgi:DNA-binding IclR family transcriptional regulator